MSLLTRFVNGSIVSSERLMRAREFYAPSRPLTDPTQAFAHWDNIDVHYQGEILTSRGHGFSGLGRPLHPGDVVAVGRQGRMNGPADLGVVLDEQYGGHGFMVGGRYGTRPSRACV